MQQIEVGRGLFWAGVLILVATLALIPILAVWQNPPYYLSLDWNPVLLVAAIFLLLFASVAPRPPIGQES